MPGRSEIDAEPELSMLFALARILGPQRSQHGTGSVVRYVALGGLHPAIARVVASTGAEAEVDRAVVDLSAQPREAPAALADEAFAALGRRVLARERQPATEDGLREIERLSQGAPTEEMTPARQALLDYVQALGGLAATVGSALGEETLFEPTEYRLRATPVMEADLAGMDPAPTIVDWPASIGLDLATASDCVRVSADAVGTVFTDADQLTHFRQDDVIYRLAVAGVLPGDPVC